MSLRSFFVPCCLLVSVGFAASVSGGILRGRTFDSAEPSHNLAGIEIHVKPEGHEISESLTNTDGIFMVQLHVPLGTMLHVTCDGSGYSALPKDIRFDKEEVTNDVCMYKTESELASYWDAVARSSYQAAIQGYDATPGPVVLWKDVADGIGINPVGKTYLSKAMLKYSPSLTVGLKDFREYRDADADSVKAFAAAVTALASKDGNLPTKNMIIAIIPNTSLPPMAVISDVFAVQLRTKAPDVRNDQIKSLRMNWDENIAVKTDEILAKGVQ